MQNATTCIYFMSSDETTGNLIVSASLCSYQLRLFQDYQSPLENIYSGSQILTVKIRNGRKKSKFVIPSVPESQTAYFPLFFCYPDSTLADRIARQSEFPNYFTCEVGLSGNRRKGKKNGVADFYSIFSLERA